MVNVDRAKVTGIEVKTHLDLHNIINSVPNGFKFYGALGYSKGKLSNGSSLLSVQPIKAVLGLDYEDPNGKWGIFTRFTYLGAKKQEMLKQLKINVICVREEFDDCWYKYL